MRIGDSRAQLSLRLANGLMGCSVVSNSRLNLTRIIGLSKDCRTGRSQIHPGVQVGSRKLKISYLSQLHYLLRCIIFLTKEKQHL